MTYITKYLPELDILKKEIESNPDVLRIYSKYMGFSGSEESIDYLIFKLDEYSNKKSN
jgi:hypothetical protein